MSGLIDRKQAIEEIYRKVSEQESNAIQGEDLDVGVIVGLKMAVRIIKEQPSAEMPDRWLFINEKNEPKFWQYNIRNGQISPITDLEDTSITWRVGMPFEEITGHWENIDIIHDRKDAKITDWQQAQCSVCGKWHTKPYLYGIDLDPYCPSCGARMVNDNERFRNRKGNV